MSLKSKSYTDTVSPGDEMYRAVLDQINEAVDELREQGIMAFHAAWLTIEPCDGRKAEERDKEI